MTTIFTNGVFDLLHVGHIPEWHLHLVKAFDHIAFRFPSWFSKKAVMLGPPFSKTRFKPVGAVGNVMAGNGVK